MEGEEIPNKALLPMFLIGGVGDNGPMYTFV